MTHYMAHDLSWSLHMLAGFCVIGQRPVLSRLIGHSVHHGKTGRHRCMIPKPLSQIQVLVSCRIIGSDLLSQNLYLSSDNTILFARRFDVVIGQIQEDMVPLGSDQAVHMKDLCIMPVPIRHVPPYRVPLLNVHGIGEYHYNIIRTGLAMSCATSGGPRSGRLNGQVTV